MIIHLHAVVRMHREGAELKKRFGKPAAELIPASFHDERSGNRVVFCVHGFSASVLEFKYLFESFRKEGISYHAVPLTGFGEFNAQKLTSVSAADWVNQVSDELKKVSEKYSEIVILGHSMGSLLCLITSRIVSPEMIVLSAPYLEVKENHRFLKKVVLNKFLYNLLLLFRPCTIKSGNKSIHKYRSYRFVYDTVPAQAVKNLWEMTEMYTLTDYRDVPFHIFLGGKDNTVENDNIQSRFTEAGIRFTPRVYPELGHNLLEESAGDAVLRQICAIVQAR